MPYAPGTNPPESLPRTDHAPIGGVFILNAFLGPTRRRLYPSHEAVRRIGRRPLQPLDCSVRCTVDRSTATCAPEIRAGNDGVTRQAFRFGTSTTTLLAKPIPDTRSSRLETRNDRTQDVVGVAAAVQNCRLPRARHSPGHPRLELPTRARHRRGRCARDRRVDGRVCSAVTREVVSLGRGELVVALVRPMAQRGSRSRSVVKPPARGYSVSIAACRRESVHAMSRGSV